MGGRRLTLEGCMVKQYRLNLAILTSLHAFLLSKAMHNQLVPKASLLTLLTAPQAEHASQIMWISGEQFSSLLHRE